MRPEEFFNVLADIDDDMITKAKSSVSDAVGGVVIRRPWKPLAAAAACLAVLMIGAAVIIGVYSRKETVKTVDSGGNSENSGAVTAEYPENAKYQYTGDFSELELCGYGILDRRVYDDFYQLEKNSSLIVVGTFVDNARQDVPLDEEPKPFTTLNGSSFNKLRIDKVYKGDIAVGSEIIIEDSYYVNNGRLMYLSSGSSTPMINGEQWVYFLTGNSDGSGVYRSLFTEGRYPVPGNENVFVLTKNNKHYVFEPGDFSESTYEDVKIMLGAPGKVQRYELEDKTSKRVEFTMPEFVGDTFAWTPRSLYVTDKLKLVFNNDLTREFYFADLTGDGKRELVFMVYSEDHGNFIMAYDHTNSKLYHLKEHLNGDEVRAPLDYGLGVNDGVLYAYERSVNAAEVCYEKPLTLDLMTEVDLSDNPMTYESKTYNVVNRLYTEDGVTFTIGLTKPEYEAGEFVEVLGIVENNSDKEIGMYTPGINAPFNGEISIAIKQGDVRLEDKDIYFVDCAIGSTIVKPGERFVHAFLFDTREERLDDKDTIVPLCKPTGIFDGNAGISLFEDPHDTSSETKSYVLNFEVNLFQSTGDAYPHKQVFGIEEFGNDVKFELTADSLTVNDGSGKFKVFGDMQIKNMYLLDINRDGKREICANVSSYEKGYAHIMAYDYANRKLYDLSDPGYYDYRMRVTHDIDGSYNIKAEKFVYSSTERAGTPFLVIPYNMKAVTQLSDNKREPVKGVTEITEFDKSFTMEEFPTIIFHLSRENLRCTNKYGENKELFPYKTDRLFLYDMNGDGKREIIIDGYHTWSIGNTGKTELRPGIELLDLENSFSSSISPNKELSLTIKDDDLYVVIDGETDPEPLTYERFEELAKSPYI